MRTKVRLLLSATLLSCAVNALAATHYVDLNSANPTPPYTNWATAARVIQDAVDAAGAGDEVVVTNGVYASDGRPATGSALTNRVTVDKPLTLRSVNGPAVTTIQGFQMPGGTNGNAAVRCVYLAEGASLSGFTLRDGATRRGGGGPDQRGGGVFCASGAVSVSNCVITANSADFVGGGVSGGTVDNCILRRNSAGNSGGGAAGDIDVRCTLNNCALTGNSAYYGGGAAECSLYNCTLVANWAQRGGGSADSTLKNCIVFFNSADSGANYDEAATLNYCCTRPQPVQGSGNITLDPQLASAWHISALSPCRGAGSPAGSTGVDIDGESWGDPPSIGCDEYRAGTVRGPLSVAIATAYTNVATGHPIQLDAQVDGLVTASVWDFGDGGRATNQPYVSHAWSTAGNYAVTVAAYNETYPSGVSATVTVHVVTQPVHYVSLASTNPVPPYSSWATAARSIQDAVDQAEVGSEIVVTNGTYTNGGRAVYGTMTNRVAVDRPLTLRSVNGRQLTIIEGHQVPGVTNGQGAIRCVYLTAGSLLSGFTLTKGATQLAPLPPPNEYAWEGPIYNGGGVWCQSTAAIVSNCVIVTNSAAVGGGAFRAALSNCSLVGNTSMLGAGASECILDKCTLTANMTLSGGGGAAYGCTLSNCMLTNNSGGGALDSTLTNCILSGNSGGGAASSTLDSCTLTANWSDLGGGGGAVDCILNNCTLNQNVSIGDNSAGGGASGGTLTNCTLIANIAEGEGGGVFDSILQGCTLIGNSARRGGGASYSTLNSCTLSNNVADPTSGTGGGAFECVLNNSTVANNSSGGPGGGVSSCTLNNCALTGNSATHHWVFNGPYGEGGGASFSTLNNCILIGNVAAVWGGGAHRCALSNCTLTGNSAYGSPAFGSSLVGGGGGAAGGTLNNCVVYFNTATNGANFYQDDFIAGRLSYCCTTPLPADGFNNITNAPLFVDAAVGNLRLQSNSPCINAGNNAYVSALNDLDSNPRIVSGTVDIGAYEFQNPASLLSYAWLQQYGLPIDGSADSRDPDADGLNNWQEWRCLTDPTIALSALRLVKGSATSTNVTVTWQSVAGVNYFLERSTNLAGPPPIFTPLTTGIPGQPGTTTYIDNTAVEPGPFFYRVGVQE